MKSGTCPKCQSRDLLLVEEVLVADYTSANATNPLTLTAHYGETGEVGFLGPKQARTSIRIEARVCSACAYTELYAKDLTALVEFARSRKGGVRALKP